MIEDVIELRAELHLQALNWCRELLVESHVSLIHGLPAARVAAGSADGAEVVACAVLDRRQDECIGVDVVDVTGVGRAVLSSLGDWLAGNVVRTIFVRAPVGS